MSDCCAPDQPPQEVTNPPTLSTPGTTILVTDPTSSPCLTDLEETDAVGAMRRGLREYAARARKDVAGVRVQLAAVYKEWAEVEDDDVRYPAAAVLTPEPVLYDASVMTPQVESRTLPSGRYLSRHAEATTTLAFQVQCSLPDEREAVRMMLEEAFNPVTWMTGFRLELPFYFGQRAEYEVLSVRMADDAGTSRHGLWQLEYMITGRIAVVRPRDLPLAQIKLVADVSEAPVPPSRPLRPLGPAKFRKS